MTGKLVTLEGIDGVGKTTQSQLLVEYFHSEGLDVKYYREPGGTELGERLRDVIKEGVAESAVAELMLFGAARSELVSQKLQPDLAAGNLVVLDRFTDSTLAYQGALEGISDSVLVSVCLAAAGGLYPDLTIWLDLDLAEAIARRKSKWETDTITADVQEQPLDVIEQRSLEYFTRVQERYLSLFNTDQGRIHRLDCSGNVDSTAAKVRNIARAWLASWRGSTQNNGAGS